MGASLLALAKSILISWVANYSLFLAQIHNFTSRERHLFHSSLKGKGWGIIRIWTKNARNYSTHHHLITTHTKIGQ